MFFLAILTIMMSALDAPHYFMLTIFIIDISVLDQTLSRVLLTIYQN